MQKIVNLFAVVGFLLAVANTSLVIFAVLKGPSMANKAMSEIELKMTTILFDKLESAVEESMPGQVKELMPSQTGPALLF
tara:strand:- start:576 stop:815 length:240 start_codon:yes stop_codon:yes gene_type:complete